jgi:hypothetical protein
MYIHQQIVFQETEKSEKMGQTHDRGEVKVHCIFASTGTLINVANSTISSSSTLRIQFFRGTQNLKRILV